MPFGFGKRAWRRASGISNLQRKVSRRIGVPLSGRRSRKAFPGKGCMLLLVAFVLATASLACSLFK